MIVIQCIDTTDALFTMIKRAVTEVMQTANTASVEADASKQEWITTPVLKAYLKEKGYSATSSLTIKKIASNNNIRTEKLVGSSGFIYQTSCPYLLRYNRWIEIDFSLGRQYY